MKPSMIQNYVTRFNTALKAQSEPDNYMYVAHTLTYGGAIYQFTVYQVADGVTTELGYRFTTDGDEWEMRIYEWADYDFTKAPTWLKTIRFLDSPEHCVDKLAEAIDGSY